MKRPEGAFPEGFPFQNGGWLGGGYLCPPTQRVLNDYIVKYYSVLGRSVLKHSSRPTSTNCLGGKPKPMVEKGFVYFLALEARF